MELVLKLATYILLISTFDNTLTNPILREVHDGAIVNTLKNGSPRLRENSMQKFVRLRRKDPVVQPAWTTEQRLEDLFADLNVRVTDRKLEEADSIRGFIKSIVQNGSFAVELDKSDFKEDSEDLDSQSESTPESETPLESKTETDPNAAVEIEDYAEAQSVTELEDDTKTDTVTQTVTEFVVTLEPKAKSKPAPVVKNGLSTLSKFSKKLKKIYKIEIVGNPFITWLKKMCLLPKK